MSLSQQFIVAETTGTTTGFNQGVDKVKDILGLDSNGWGLPIIDSRRIEGANYRANVLQWNRLLDDVNQINLHVYGTVTNITSATTSTQIVGTLLEKIDELDAVRYTCHPSQFQYSTVTNTSTIVSDSSSVRSLPWGFSTSSITHQVVVGFIDSVAAGYYFNQGNYLTWKPYYLISNTTTISSSVSRIVNDLDGEWANFIDDIIGNGSYIYDRDKFINYNNTTTYWTSGTLHIELNAAITGTNNVILFTALYYNDSVTALSVSPSVGLYPILLPA